jgi:hypothetical protein
MPDPVSVAYHEAGHAVVAALSPYHQVDETVIETENRGLTKSNGSSSFIRLKDNNLWEFRIVVAGGAGEKILDPKSDPWNLDGLFSGCPSAAHMDLITSDFGLGADEDPEEYARREQRLIRDTCKLLRKHEMAVHQVAKVLRTKGRISGDEVRSIVGPVRKAKPAKVER